MDGTDAHEHESTFERLLVWGQIILCVILLVVVVRVARKGKFTQFQYNLIILAFSEVLEEEKREEDMPSRPLVEVPVDA
jgi:hypothetical protein